MPPASSSPRREAAAPGAEVQRLRAANTALQQALARAGTEGGPHAQAQAQRVAQDLQLVCTRGPWRSSPRLFLDLAARVSLCSLRSPLAPVDRKTQRKACT